MNRIPLLLATSVVLACAGAPDEQVEVAAAPVQQPNVLLILIDDLRPEMGAYGVSRAVTPNLDEFARTGLLFTRAYTQQAVCAPSRIALMSGLRPDSTGIYDLNTPVSTVLPEHVTMPQLFRRHGYEAVSIGKIYHHKSDDPSGWSVEPIDPTGEWQGRGYLDPESIRAVEEYARAHPDMAGRGPAYEGPAVPDTAYPDGKIASRAIEHIERMKDRPFFLAVGFKKPHLPFNAPKKYWDLYPESSIELPHYRQAPEKVPQYSMTNFGELRNYTNIPKEGPISDEQSRELIRGYLASTSYTDAQVGRVLDALERLGLEDETIVVVWGDHGWKLGEYGTWAKHTNFEIDTRIPLIARVPWIGADGRTDAFVETVDVYPTLADLTGLPRPVTQGVSFTPVLRDPEIPWKTAAFSEYPRGGGIMGRSIRTDRYHYVEWQDRQTGEVRARELYDHEVDPGETRNVAEDPANAQVVQDLSRRLKAGWRAARPAGAE